MHQDVGTQLVVAGIDFEVGVMPYGPADPWERRQTFGAPVDRGPGIGAIDRSEKTASSELSTNRPQARHHEIAFNGGSSPCDFR
jgi:hypothetical protein